MATVDIDRDTAHDAAQRELGKPSYPRPSLTQYLADWIDEQISRLLLKSSTVPGGWFTVAILLIVVVAAVLIAVRVARRTMRTNRGDSHLFGALDRSAAQHRSAAAACAAAGDWAMAVRHRLRAVARHLEETGTLTTASGRTAVEFARDAGARIPALAPRFDAAATLFDGIAYGHLPGTADDYRLIVDLDDALTHADSRTPPR